MSLTDIIYLDYQATTPMAPEARDAMWPYLHGHFWNPHSAHRGGRAVAAVVESARENVAALLPPGGRVIFTSGATEAINLAAKGAGLPIAASAIEHAAVLDCVEYLGGQVLPVDEGGILKPLLFKGGVGVISDRSGSTPEQAASHSATTPNPSSKEEGLTSGALLAVMHVNNEIGTIQPVAELAALAHERGALFLCDAVQSYGRMPIPEGPDMIAISAHKIHGPKGIGALWVREGIALAPLIHGGGQEQGLRSGTLSPALCAGFGAAAKLAGDRMEQDAAHVSALWDHAVDLFSDWTVNGSTEHRYLGNLNIRRDGVDVGRLMSECRDIAFSAGSACASGSGRPSHVLRAIGLTDAQAKSSIRLGFGRYTTMDDLDEAAAQINAAVREML